MKAPYKIYLQICGDCPGVDSCGDCKFGDLEDNVTWCLDRIFEKDVEYVRKDYLLGWAKRRRKEVEEQNVIVASVRFGADAAFEEMIEKLKKI